jgi:hypothetical protein
LIGLVEVGRFFATAAIVAASSIVPLTILPLFTEANSSVGFFAFVVAGITFVIAVVAGVLIGLPMLHLAKVLGWDNQLWKFSTLGLIAGTFTVAAIIMIFSDEVASSEVWKEVFPPYAAFGGFGGLVAALSWYWLHRNERASINV